MEKIIGNLERDLRDIIDGKPVKNLRGEMGDKMDIRALRMVVFSLQWASVGYQSALRLAGMKLGNKIGTSSEKTELSLVLEEIKKMLEALGEGRVEVEIEPELKGAQIKIHESSLTANVPNVMQTLCFFEEGFIEGYIDGVISKIGSLAVAGGQTSVNKVTVEEKRCIGLGDDFCGFLIKF
ncbi:MAG: V4R domain-containing protein [Patescibacteria group bacterium]